MPYFICMEKPRRKFYKKPEWYIPILVSVFLAVLFGGKYYFQNFQLGGNNQQVEGNNNIQIQGSDNLINPTYDYYSINTSCEITKNQTCQDNDKYYTFYIKDYGKEGNCPFAKWKNDLNKSIRSGSFSITFKPELLDY